METLTAIVVATCVSWFPPNNEADADFDGEAAPAETMLMMIDHLGPDRSRAGLGDVTAFLLLSSWNDGAVPDPDFAAPAERPAVISTLTESFDAVSHQELLKLGFGFPLNLPTGILSFNLEGQGRVDPPDPWLFLTNAQFAAIDQGLVHFQVQWQDGRRDEFTTTLGSQYDFLRANHFRGDLAFCLKAMLPEPFHPWYLQSEFRADSARSEQAALSLGASWHRSNGSQVTSRFGLSNRESRTRSRHKRTSDTLNWATQWKLHQRLGVAITLTYSLDVHDVEAMMSLELKSPGLRMLGWRQSFFVPRFQRWPVFWRDAAV